MEENVRGVGIDTARRSRVDARLRRRPRIARPHYMAELGVQPHHIEAVLNHQSGHKASVAGIYNRAKYEPEMRTALQRWADWIERISA
jgi:hypothetical protein